MGKKYRTSCCATLRSLTSILCRDVSTKVACEQFCHQRSCARVQAGLGVATDGEEECIDGGEVAERVEDDKSEQGAAGNVNVYLRVRRRLY